MNPLKIHLVTGKDWAARSYCGRTVFGRKPLIGGTPSVEKFRAYWLNNPSHVCASCVAKAKALKII